MPEKRDVAELLELGLKCEDAITEREGSDYTVEHKFCGRPGIQGADGGNGGCGGPGGKSGKIQLFGLTNQTNIVAFQQNGMEKLCQAFSFILKSIISNCWEMRIPIMHLHFVRCTWNGW